MTEMGFCNAVREALYHSPNISRELEGLIFFSLARWGGPNEGGFVREFDTFTFSELILENENTPRIFVYIEWSLRTYRIPARDPGISVDQTTYGAANSKR